MPGRPGTGENMRFRTDRGRVDQRAHGDMDEGALPNHRPEQRAAMLAVHVMRGLCGRPAVDQQIVISPDKLQAVAGNAGERFECRTSGAPAVRTMAIERIFERIRDRVAHRAAKAFAGKHASLRIF